MFGAIGAVGAIGAIGAMGGGGLRLLTLILFCVFLPKHIFVVGGEGIITGVTSSHVVVFGRLYHVSQTYMQDITAERHPPA